MRLTDQVEKIKRFPDIGRDAFVAGLIILVGVASFALGRLSALDDRSGQGIRHIVAEQSKIEPFSAPNGMPNAEGGGGAPSSSGDAASSNGMYVGSKSGSTYHLPWCSGASRIKDANKIWFASKEEAESLGYRPAANCKGI